MDAQAPSGVAQLAGRWLYDWDGANVNILLAVHGALPDGLLWLPRALSVIGSYYSAPAVVILLLARYKAQSAGRSAVLRAAACQFAIGLALALAAAVIAKDVFALPRPFVVLEAALHREALAPDSRFSFPSGHAVYAGVLAAALWPVFGRPGKIGLLLFAATVCWSRVVLGAHFPADVVAGFALGFGCAAAAGPVARRIAERLRPSGAHP